MRHETAIFGPDKTNPENWVIMFFAYFLLFQQQKAQTFAETPIFIVF